MNANKDGGNASFNLSSNSGASDEPLLDAIINWVATFQGEIGDDAILDSFEQFNDGVILMKIVKTLTQGQIVNIGGKTN